MFEHRSFQLPLLTSNNKHFTWFSHGTCHPPVSTLTLTLRTHTITTVHTTKTDNSTQFLIITYVCVRLKNINNFPSQQFGVMCTEISRYLSGLNICTCLCGQRSYWYIIRTFLNFTGFTPLLCVKGSLKIRRG